MDVNNEPILVPPCGHPLTVSILDDMMHIDEHYQKQLDESLGVEVYVALKALQKNYCANSQVACNVCLKPIGASFLRYGRPVKHKQLCLMMEEFRRSHLRKLWVGDRRLAHDATQSLIDAKGDLLVAIANHKAHPSPTQPDSTGKKIKVRDGVLFGDLGEIASLYQIPWKQQTAWTAAITPVKDIMASLSQPFVERTPLKDVAIILATKSQNFGPNSPWEHMDPYGHPSQKTRHAYLLPTKEGMAQALLILGLEHLVGPRGQFVKQRELADTRFLSMIMMGVFDLAFTAMNTAGAESGWFWFLRDLVECCQAFNYRFKTTAIDSDNLSSDNVSRATERVLKCFSMNLHCMTARPLGGMQSSEEFQEAVEEIERAFLAEVSEQRRGSWPRGEYDVELNRIVKEVEVLIQGAKRQGGKLQKQEWDGMKEW
ncbi:hypothetical protein EC991_001533 [Linnemannia zychae]|nr:hypothetical protein EC991_001533 [Linnemannia zychae]